MSEGSVLDPEAFAELVEARLRAEEALEVSRRDGLTLYLHVGQSEINLALDNFYNAYTAQPAQLEAVLETLVRTLRNYDQARAITSFDQLRERVFPMLKPINLLLTVRERNLPMLVYRPFIADLIITYVIDEPSSLAYINEQHLERWGITETELHTQAMVNLRRRTDERGEYTITGEGAKRLIIFKSQDGFDATRLLLPDLIERWRDGFPAAMVIGIPNRDFLIVFCDADQIVLTSIAHQIQLDAAQREHGLTDQLFTLEDGQVREYGWE